MRQRFGSTLSHLQTFYYGCLLNLESQIKIEIIVSPLIPANALRRTSAFKM